MPTTSQKIHTFRLKHNRIANVIVTPVEICTPSGSEETVKRIQTKGIWDTGASHTVITKNIIDQLELKSIGITKVNTASESDKEVNTYLVDVHLNNLVFIGLQVTVGKITSGIDCLIGMDIINMGDFSITNFQGKTCMSFRVPSMHEIDYLKAHQSKNQIRTEDKIGRNDPCPCGSGKKYKRCHGQ